MRQKAIVSKYKAGFMSATLEIRRKMRGGFRHTIRDRLFALKHSEVRIRSLPNRYW